MLPTLAYDEFTSGSFDLGADASAVAITAGAQAGAGTGGASAGASTGPATGNLAPTSYHKGIAGLYAGPLPNTVSAILPTILRYRSSSNRALPSFRSAVSNPSVNHP